MIGCILGARPSRAASPDVWPAQVTRIADQAAAGQRIASLAAAAATLPPVLAPAIQFQEAFVRIMAGAGEPDWLPAMRVMAGMPGTDAVATAVSGLAKAWIARAEMREIGEALDGFYAQNVRYPDSLAAVEHGLPQQLQSDPWGEPWVYRTHAPAGFENEASQRYSLGPKRFPELGTIKEATLDRPAFTPPAWRITVQPAGASVALEFRMGATPMGLLQPGGKLGEYTLVYIGQDWALMAGRDQLFTVSF